MNRNAPGLDADGFRSIDDLRRLAETPDDFLRSVLGPALLVEPQGPPAAGAAPPALAPPPAGDAGRRTVIADDGATGRATECARYARRVAFLTKRPGNPFPEMVSIGRASTSDLVLALSSVSKLHGYFLRDGARWSFSDHRSTNGTTINGERLGPGARRLLEDGDRIGVGNDLTLRFLLPASLLERTRA